MFNWMTPSRRTEVRDDLGPAEAAGDMAVDGAMQPQVFQFGQTKGRMSGIVSTMARAGLGRCWDWDACGRPCLNAGRWIGTCAALSLRFCQNHCCRDVAACAPELLQIASFLTDVGELIKRRRRADQPGGRRDDEH